MDFIDVSNLVGESKNMGLVAQLPWWAKLGAKLALARLPIPYDFWRRLGLFRHGEMNHPARSIKTFDTYFQRALVQTKLPSDFRSLELGPGDSILSGIVARAYGASEAWLVDAGAFADTDVAACRQTVELLRTQGKVAPNIANANMLTQVLQQANVHYLTQGTDSLAAIPSASIDFFWSQVVLEHVPRAEFPRFLRELRRIVTSNSIGVHSIDFRDHLGGGLNNLRFNHATWEGSFFSSSGFYTNRLRPREMLSMFAEAGFEVEIIGEARWPKMPIKRQQLAAEFQSFTDEDFLVAEIEVVLRPKFDIFSRV